MGSNKKEYLEKVDLLIKTIDGIYLSTRQLAWRSFLKGLFVGLGTTVGVSVVLALAAFIISLLKRDPLFKTIFDVLQIDRVLPEK